MQRSTCTSLSHLTDHALLQSFRLALAQERQANVSVLEHITEIETRRLCRPAGYSSTFTYCVGEFGMQRDVAFTRIRVARAARRFPDILAALADGRLHLTAVVLLAPYLGGDSAAELLAAAEKRSKSEIELLLAQRFPKPDVPAVLRPLAVMTTTCHPGPELLGIQTPESASSSIGKRDDLPAPAVSTNPSELAPELVGMTSGAHVTSQSGAPRAPNVPSPQPVAKYLLQVTIRRETQETLRYVQALLGHALPAGDLATVLDGALRVYARHLEKARLGAGSRLHPGRRRRRVPNERHVPTTVRHEVWERDGGQCAFGSESGHRCESRMRLEFDHVVPVARGGLATAENLRLLCRARNQHAAERLLGSGFMDAKREASRHRALAKSARRPAISGPG